MPDPYASASPPPDASPKPTAHVHAHKPPHHRPRFWRRLWQHHAERRGLRWGLGLATVAAAVLTVVALRYGPSRVPEAAPASVVEREGGGLPAVVPVSAAAPGRVTFRVRTPAASVPFSTFALFAQPGEAVPVSAEGRAGRYTLTAPSGTVRPQGESKWLWTAPETPGPVRLTLREAGTGETVTLQAIVRTPFDPRQTQIGTYRIGRYVLNPRDPVYAPPEGLIALTPETANLQISPHFRLKDFRCKQPGGPPEFVLVNERLLVKLERLIERLKAEGHAVSGLTVMSGYRTPHYNASIGNETSLSAHLYGMAADVYVDEDGDGMLDDLDGDGQVTLNDAKVMHRIAETLDADPEVRGGLGLYHANSVRGPFIHLDVRGQRARW
ncbi:MAG TPA: D-Ala-D-Ala carboxypeptidase family metallohydrolase [Rhodothermales bacterium]|nr:D-Ala-D-Ala carboxypeptidase family metallohydrolase [Rhodothermales bacterium]